MNQKEWIEAFEKVNNRKPSPQEFKEAKEAGDFTVEGAKAFQS